MRLLSWLMEERGSSAADAWRQTTLRRIAHSTTLEERFQWSSYRSRGQLVAGEMNCKETPGGEGAGEAHAMPSMMGGVPFLTAGSSMCAQCEEASTGSPCAVPVVWSGRGPRTGVCSTQPIEKCWEGPIEDSNRLLVSVCVVSATGQIHNMMCAGIQKKKKKMYTCSLLLC